MPKINVLDKSVAELIAAGEVIERPASIVKELVENSIDAGSTQVTVEIKNGGTTFIRVSDNGCGIDKDDVEIAFLRHATSKILKAQDLDEIYTLGFRGEALASISAVSHTELITKTINQEIGRRVILEGYEVIENVETGCQTGTVITVSNLFYNTPARMKFLKKDVSEANAVASYIEKLALSNPQISFKFIRDGKMTINTPGDGDLFKCIYTVLGKDFANGMISTNYDEPGVKVKGFICKPQNAKGNRSQQQFFINGRYIRSKTLMAALEEAYKNSIMVSKYPSCVLFITMMPEFCDINVHPQKLEVRFADEKLAFHSVYYAVKQALLDFNSPKQGSFSSSINSNNINNNAQSGVNTQSVNIPINKPSETKSYIENVKKHLGFSNISDDIEHKQPEQTKCFTTDFEEKPSMFFSTKLAKQADYLTQEKDNHLLITCDENIPIIKQSYQEKVELLITPDDEYLQDIASENTKNGNIEPAISDVGNKVVDQQKATLKTSVKVIGEVFKTYIIVQKGEEMLFIDKHAAHERIIFERLKTRNDIVSQILLNPVVVNLSREEFDIIIQNKSEIEEKCFSFDEFGDNAIIIREIPSVINEKDVIPIITEIAGNLIQNRFNKNYTKLDWIYHSVSCRAAIKANDDTSLVELQALVDDVFTIQNIKHCPHGRPIIVNMSKQEIEKQFGRI